MSATVILFPVVPRPAPLGVITDNSPEIPGGSSAEVAQLAPPSSTAQRYGQNDHTFTAGWADRHLPLIDAARRSIAADDADFATRIARMTDDAGLALLAELLDGIDCTAEAAGAVGEALDMVARRIRSCV